MAIGPEEVGEEVGVAGIALAPGGGVARSAGFDDVGVDGDDGEAGLEERVDDEARGALEGDGQRGGGARSECQPLDELGPGPRRCAPRCRASGRCRSRRCTQTAWVVAAQSRPAKKDIARLPGTARHCARERSCRSLTDWRSGLQLPVALHPVAGWDLSWCESGEQVSRWPSRGKRTWALPDPRDRHSGQHPLVGGPGPKKCDRYAPVGATISGRPISRYPPSRGSCLSSSGEG